MPQTRNYIRPEEIFFQSRYGPCLNKTILSLVSRMKKLCKFAKTLGKKSHLQVVIFVTFFKFRKVSNVLYCNRLSREVNYDTHA